MGIMLVSTVAFTANKMEYVTLVIITETTKLVPYHLVESL